MKTNPKQDQSEFDQFADELLAEKNGRPLVIIGASKVEDLLFQILSAYLLPKLSREKDRDELLEGDRPLATFSARIKLCRRLALIDETLYRVLDTLRELRNTGAHSISFDLTKSPIREYLTGLREKVASRKSYRLTKDRYFNNVIRDPIEDLQCLLLTICVLLEAIRAKTTTPKVSAAVLRISRS